MPFYNVFIPLRLATDPLDWYFGDMMADRPHARGVRASGGSAGAPVGKYETESCPVGHIYDAAEVLRKAFCRTVKTTMKSLPHCVPNSMSQR